MQLVDDRKDQGLTRLACMRAYRWAPFAVIVSVLPRRDVTATIEALFQVITNDDKTWAWTTHSLPLRPLMSELQRANLPSLDSHTALEDETSLGLVTRVWVHDRERLKRAGETLRIAWAGQPGTVRARCSLGAEDLTVRLELGRLTASGTQADDPAKVATALAALIADWQHQVMTMLTPYEMQTFIELDGFSGATAAQVT